MSQSIDTEKYYQILEKTHQRLEQLYLEYNRRLTKLEQIFTPDIINNWDRDISTEIWEIFVEKLREWDTITNLFRIRGIEVRETSGKSRVTRPNIMMEISMLAASYTQVVAIECYPYWCKEEVDLFLDKLNQFKKAFPSYQNYQACGALAGIEIDENVVNYAYRQGLFVIKPLGDTVTIINDARFQVKFW